MSDGTAAGVPVTVHELDTGWSRTWSQGDNPRVRFEVEFTVNRNRWLQRMKVGDAGGWCSPVVLDLPVVDDADEGWEVVSPWIAQRVTSGP